MSTLFPAIGTRTVRTTIIAAALVATASSANAALSGESNAHALQANVGLVGNLIGINVGPLPLASGTSPNPYNVNNSLVIADVSVPIVGSLSTDLINAHATSNITGSSITGLAAADASVDGLSLVVIPGIVFTPDVLNLSATTIASNAEVSFDGTNVTTSGGFTIEDLTLSINGANIVVNANAAPNTVLFNSLGIFIIVNEQVPETIGDTTTMTVNAIRISLNLPAQLVSGNVTIGHSFASMTVPAPATAGMFGACGLAALRRRRR